MKNLLLPLLLLVLPVLSSTALAVREVGNGGDAIVCNDPATGAVTQVLLYDYYEADHIRRIFPIGFSKVYGTYQEYLEEMFLRIGRLNPNRAKLYREWYANFANEAEFIRGISLVDIPDTGNGYVPKNCKLEQLVVQREPRFQSEMRYTVSLDLFEKLGERDKAGMILHELILRETVHQGTPHTDSINTRVFNSMVSSSKIETMNLKEYLDWLAKLRIDKADAQFAIPIIAQVGMKFHDDNTVAEALPSMRVNTLETVDVKWRGQPLSIYTWSMFKFNRDGHLQKWHLDSPTELLMQKMPVLIEGKIDYFELTEGDRPTIVRGEIPVVTSALRAVCAEIALDTSGNLSKCKVSGKSPSAEILYQGKWTEIKTDDRSVLGFDSNGALISAASVEFERIETAEFRGRCLGASISSGASNHIANCQGASGEIRIGGKWIPYVPAADWIDFLRGAISFGSSGEILAVGAFVPHVKNAFYQGSCSGVTFDVGPIREVAGCGEGKGTQRSRGSILIFGKWHDHSGAFEVVDGKLATASNITDLKAQMFSGDLRSIQFAASGSVAKATLMSGGEVKQVTVTKDQWLPCWSTSCELEFGANGLLLSGLHLEFPQIGKAFSLDFFSSGELQTFRGRNANVLIKGRNVEIWDYRVSAIVEMTVTGQVRKFDGSMNGTVETPAGILLVNPSAVTFYGDETVEVATLSAAIVLPTINGPKSFGANRRVSFDRQGNASEVFNSWR